MFTLPAINKIMERCLLIGKNLEEMKKKSINFKIITVSLSLEDMSIYDKEQLWIKGVAGIQFVKLDNPSEAKNGPVPGTKLVGYDNKIYYDTITNNYVNCSFYVYRLFE
jgi:hypothetical protein